MEYTKLLELFSVPFSIIMAIIMAVVFMIDRHILSLQKAYQDTIFVIFAILLGTVLIIFDDYNFISLVLTFVVVHYVYYIIRDVTKSDDY